VSASPPLLPFVQLEYPGSAGIGDGRYLARSEGEASEVLVTATLGAERAVAGRRRRHRAVRAADDPGAATIPVTRLTVVTPTPLEPDEAARWLDDVSKDPEAAAAQVETTLRLINLAISAQRAGGQNPYVHELDASRAVAIRVGFGVGDDVADGNWTDAREIRLPAERDRRAETLQAQERVAAVLGGRDAVLACETLVLRAHLDLDEDRRREAALQLRVGLEALLRELADDSDSGVQEDVAVLQDRRDEVVEAANGALTGDLSDDQAEALGEVIARCERALRRRRTLS
jgi:hypothetical protein